jgi:hypothetical protein
MPSQSRKHRGFRTERVVAQYLSQWWRSASIGRGFGKDIHNVPFDIEVKARADFKPQEWLRQVIKRSDRKELSAVVVRCNGMGEDASQYLAFMRFDDLVQLLLRAGYGDLQQDSVQLEPERCNQCGSWKIREVPCRTCQKVPKGNHANI